MYCSQCAHELTPSDVYCPKCAKAVASFNFDPGQIPQVEYIGEETPTVVRPSVTVRPPVADPRPVARAAGKSFYKWILGGGVVGFIFVVLALFGVGAVFVFILMSNQTDGISPVNAARNARRQAESVFNNAPQPTPAPEKAKKYLLIDSRIPVAAGQLVSFDFEVQSPARVTGGFVTYGGSNDIDAYIVDESNYNAMVNGYGFRFVFGRPKSQQSKINVLVPAGRWHVVFSNKHALFTAKEVAAEVSYQEQ